MRSFGLLGAVLLLSGCGDPVQHVAEADTRSICDFHKLRNGMTEDELRSACGKPDVRNGSSIGDTQWVYYRSDVYVYVSHQGLVTAFQWSER